MLIKSRKVDKYEKQINIKSFSYFIVTKIIKFKAMMREKRKRENIKAGIQFERSVVVLVVQISLEHDLFLHKIQIIHNTRAYNTIQFFV